ncbi:MAG: rRNA maturation RNase YbeY [Lachnospiraceae bacterium]|nr:rRNA maturation RNase YbeY [Lachnospiraceae bacterium]MDD6504929.1 rRNA maturation RNase YbeY [Lachnospiraceae bacterium]
MSFFLEKECEVNFGFDEEELARRVVDYCLEYMSFPFEAEVNLTLTDNEGIRTINREFRQIDSPTDVLSFPMLSYEIPGDFRFLEEEDVEGDFNPDTGEALLGDIVISVDKVAEQAESYGHSREREFAFLIVHSMLHLFGYDHMKPDEAAVMENKQELILSGLRILRHKEEIL